MKFVVAEAEEIEAGGRKIVDVDGRSIGVFNVDGEFFALRNYCPHQGGALCDGRLWGVLRSDHPGEFDYEGSREVLACPWHGWEFHIRTGQSWCLPERLRVRNYEVTVVEGKELDEEPPAPGMVKGPYVAETFEVTRDGAYLVIDIPTAGRSAGSSA